MKNTNRNNYFFFFENKKKKKKWNDFTTLQKIGKRESFKNDKKSKMKLFSRFLYSKKVFIFDKLTKENKKQT